MTQRKIAYIEESGELDAEIMTGAELMDATTTVVRTIARDHHTDVVFAGDGAATNGRDVVLPSLPLDAKITRRQALVTGGFANHESLHKLLTDFGGLSSRVKRWAKEGRKLTKAMANAIEDIRIEAGGQTLYNGLPKSIDKTAREVNRQFIDVIYPKDPSVVNDFRKIGPVAVTWEGRRRLGYPDPSMAEAMALLPDDVRKRVVKIVDQVMKLPHGVVGMGRIDKTVAYKGSVDGAKLAERVVAQYEKEEEEKKRKEKEARAKAQAAANGNGQGSDGKGQSGDKPDGTQGGGDSQSKSGGSGDSQGEGASRGAKSEAGESKPDQETAGSGDGGKPAAGGTNGGDVEAPTNQTSGGGVGAASNTYRDEDVEPISAELAQAIQTVLGEVMAGSGSYRVLNPSGDKVEVVDVKDRATQFRSIYQTTKQKMGPQVGTVRRKLERVLMAQADSFWEAGKRSGRLDVRGSARKIIDLRQDVFKRRQEESAVNTALSILVDLSGSMSGNIKLATQATIAVCEAVEGMRVPLEVLGHNTFLDSISHQAWDALDDDGRRTISRAQNIRMSVFKEFDEPLAQSRARIGRMPYMTSGSNADGDAIIMAAKRLLERREPKRVMLVLSDGQPAYTSNNRDIRQYTRDCVQWVIEQGIEIAGLGIIDGSVARYYPHYVVVTDIEQFAKTYIDEVAKLLLGRADNDKTDLIQSKVRRGSRL